MAEQVEKVNPNLVARDEQGKPYRVRYEAVNAMLLNEFLKEHRKAEGQACKAEKQEAMITQLTATVAKQEAVIAKQQEQIEALTATVQKVSDRLELTKAAPQIVAENQ